MNDKFEKKIEQGFYNKVYDKSMNENTDGTSEDINNKSEIDAVKIENIDTIKNKDVIIDKYMVDLGSNPLKIDNTELYRVTKIIIAYHKSNMEYNPIYIINISDNIYWCINDGSENKPKEDVINFIKYLELENNYIFKYAEKLTLYQYLKYNMKKKLKKLVFGTSDIVKVNTALGENHLVKIYDKDRIKYLSGIISNGEYEDIKSIKGYKNEYDYVGPTVYREKKEKFNLKKLYKKIIYNIVKYIYYGNTPIVVYGSPSKKLISKADYDSINDFYVMKFHDVHLMKCKVLGSKRVNINKEKSNKNVMCYEIIYTNRKNNKLMRKHSIYINKNKNEIVKQNIEKY